MKPDQEIFPTVYRDKFGVEKTEIRNDGRTLRLLLRGVEFNGSSFDDFEPAEASAEGFSTNQGSLCSYRLECWMPVLLVKDGKEETARLEAVIEVGDPAPNGGVDRETVQLTLVSGDLHISSMGKTGWFDDALVEIEGSLPGSAYLRCCHTCLYSEYFPGGTGAFGGLTCFRKHDAEFLSAKDKPALLQVFEKNNTLVQETYCCGDFKRLEK